MTSNNLIQVSSIRLFRKTAFSFTGHPHHPPEKGSFLATTGGRLKPAAIVWGSSDFFSGMFYLPRRCRETRQAFAAWSFSKSLLLVLSVNASAKVRVIVLGKCQRADRAALVFLLFVQFRPFFLLFAWIQFYMHLPHRLYGSTVCLLIVALDSSVTLALSL